MADSIKDTLNSFEDLVTWDGYSQLTSVQEKDLKKTVHFLYKTLKGLYSDVGDGSQIRNYLLKESNGAGIIFLKKLQLSYVYYFAQYLSQISEFRSATKKKSKEADLKAIESLFTSLDTDDEYYKMFRDIVFENIHQLPESPFEEGSSSLSEFLSTALNKAKQLKEINVSDLSQGFDLNDLSQFELAVPDLPDYIAFQKKIWNNFDNLDQVQKFLAAIYNVALQQLVSADPEDSTFKIIIRTKTHPLLKDIVEEQLPNIEMNGLSLLKNISKNLNNVTYQNGTLIIERSVFSDFWNALIKSFTKDTKQEETSKQEDIEADTPIENRLAVNIAEYMTGKISAKEFQKRDIKIRSEYGMSLNGEQLNEVEDE